MDAPEMFVPRVGPSRTPPSDPVPFLNAPDVALQTRMVMVLECIENAVGKGCVEREIPSFSLVPVKQPPVPDEHAAAPHTPL